MITVRDEEGSDWLRRIGVSNGKINQAADLAVNLEWTNVPNMRRAADHMLASPRRETHRNSPLGPFITNSEYKAVIHGVSISTDTRKSVSSDL